MTYPASVTTLSTVTPERISWLWPGYLPAGKLVVIDGDPSTGKSTLTLDLASHVSTGCAWPDGSQGARGDVLLLSAEDGLADTIAPRLHAAGADLTRVHALLEVPMAEEDGSVRMVPPSIPRDVPTIAQIVREHRVKLVVIDVLMAYLNGKVDSHRDQDVRGVLHQLGALAEQTGCTIVLIRHLNKAGGANALYRGGGSIGIVGAARSAYLVARDPEDDGRRIFVCTKMNIAPEPPALAYRLVSDHTLGCARVEWEDGTVDITANALLASPHDEDADDRDALVEWLVGYLTDGGGERLANDVMKAGRAAGSWSPDQIKRAKKRAGITSEKASMSSGWLWTLDIDRHEGSTKGAKGAHRLSPLPSPSSVPPSGDGTEVA